jgi:hypothetical protein
MCGSSSPNQFRRLSRGGWAHLVTETMERNPEIGFASYDRLFPSQDNMPSGGFGNLIALPLQHAPRLVGNSVFLDTNFEPHADQFVSFDASPHGAC